MGFFKKLFGALGMSSTECKILVVGLDDAGKTTIMNQIMPKKVRGPTFTQRAPRLGSQSQPGVSDGAAPPA